MSIRYVEFDRQISFRAYADLKHVGVIGGKSMSQDMASCMTDKDWDMETQGALLLAVHRATQQQFRIPVVHCLVICDGKVNEASTKPSSVAATGTGKR